MRGAGGSMAGVRKIKNVRGALLPGRNLHCWILSPEA